MAATDEIAEDAETPPHVTTDEDVTAGPSGDHRVENPDTSGSPQARSVKRKRKRIRQLLSSSSEDEEEVKIIKRRGKKRKEDAGKKQKVNAVKCRLKNIRPAPLSVAAQLDEEDKVSRPLYNRTNSASHPGRGRLAKETQDRNSSSPELKKTQPTQIWDLEMKEWRELASGWKEWACQWACQPGEWGERGEQVPPDSSFTSMLNWC